MISITLEPGYFFPILSFTTVPEPKFLVARYGNHSTGPVVSCQQVDFVFPIKEKVRRTCSVCGHPQCHSVVPGAGTTERSQNSLFLVYSREGPS